ncbi:hypothetical protein JCM18920_1535 [Cutibacterium acnes JCM 18920]|nr:hypothetical protein JCM18920_1535 [Cutibacterium acnes JCM 18920]
MPVASWCGASSKSDVFLGVELGMARLVAFNGWPGDEHNGDVHQAAASTIRFWGSSTMRAVTPAKLTIPKIPVIG